MNTKSRSSRKTVHLLQRPFFVSMALATILVSATSAMGTRTENLDWAYTCGNPVPTSGSSESITTSDALYILKRAVGQADYPCPLCICDVNHSGAATTSDALAVLRRSVGQSIVFDCTENALECTPCESADLLQTLTNADGLPRSTRPHPLIKGGGATPGDSDVIFDCDDNRTISLSTWPNGGVTVTKANAVIDGSIPGESRNISLEAGSACTCGAGATNTFLVLDGNSIAVKGLSITKFARGIELSSTDDSIGGDSSEEAISFSDICDYAIKNVEGSSGGRGSEVRNTTVTGECSSQICTVDNKGAALTGSSCSYPEAGYSYNRDCYHISYHDVDFVNCPRALYASGGNAVAASILVSGGSMSGSGSPACIGPYFDADALDVAIENWTLDNCSNGLDVSEQDATVDVYSTLIQNSGDRGGIVAAGGNLTFNCSKIASNGLNTGCSAECGGLVLKGTNSQLHLGTQASDRFVGKNYICSNRDGGPTDTLRDLLHKKGSYDLKAENNWWCVASSPYTPTVGTTGSERVYLAAAGSTAGLTTNLTSAPTFPPAGTCQ